MSAKTHLMTAEELIDLPDGYRYELVKGELLTMSPSSAAHGAVTMNISLPVATYIKSHKLGIAFGAETGFKLEHDPDRAGTGFRLYPDEACYDPYRRLPGDCS